MHGNEQQLPVQMSLDQCIRQVLKRNPELGIARATLAQLKEQFASAQKDLLPTISGHYYYTHQPNSIYYPTDEFQYGFTVEQPVYHGRSIVTAIKQARISRDSARLETRKVMNDLIFQVYSSYFKLLRAQKVEAEGYKSVERLTGHRKDSEAFFQAGIIPKNDYLQTDVELAQGEQDLVDDKINTSIARAELNILLGHPVEMDLQPEDDYSSAERIIFWQDTLQQAFERRPEITQACLAAEFAEKDVIMKAAPFHPQISISASYDKRGDRVDGHAADELGWPAEEKTIKAVATWKLWSWLKSQNEIAAAKIEVRRAKKAIDQVNDQVALEARTAFQHLKQAEKRIRVSTRVIKHAEENYRITQARYQSQIATSTQVLDAQSMLTRAKTNYYDAFYGRKVAVAAVDRASGALLEMYLKQNEDKAN